MPSVPSEVSAGAGDEDRLGAEAGGEAARTTTPARKVATVCGSSIRPDSVTVAPKP